MGVVREGLVTTNEAAALLLVTPGAIRKATHRGRLTPAQRSGRGRPSLYRVADLWEYERTLGDGRRVFTGRPDQPRGEGGRFVRSQ